MTWTAPDVDRTDPPDIADERAALDGWLDYHRGTLLWKCAGLSEDQLRVRPVASSTLSLLGLVRHMAMVERWWFQLNVCGRDLALPFWTKENPDGEFNDVATADAEADFAFYAGEVEAARAAVAELPLDHTFASAGHRQVERDLRWVYVHMIEEYARHNGHADLIRELVDGTTGD